MLFKIRTEKGFFQKTLVTVLPFRDEVDSRAIGIGVLCTWDNSEVFGWQCEILVRIFIVEFKFYEVIRAPTFVINCEKV